MGEVQTKRVVSPCGVYGAAEAVGRTEDMLVLRIRQPALNHSEWHEHDLAYFTIHLGGAQREEVRGTSERDHQLGDVCFHPLGERHRHLSGPQGQSGGSFILSTELLELVRCRSGLGDEPLLMRSATVRRLAARIGAELACAEAGSSILCLQSLFFELCAQAMRLSNGPRDRRAPGWLLHAEAIVRNSLDRALSLNDIAHEVGIHPVHLAQQFKRRFGMTMGDYHRRLRLEEARRRLLSEPTALAELARSLGFVDQTHFTKAFRVHFGITPGRYRSESSM